jgi:hypothetical protein
LAFEKAKFEEEQKVREQKLAMDITDQALKKQKFEHDKTKSVKRYKLFNFNHKNK